MVYEQKNTNSLSVLKQASCLGVVLWTVRVPIIISSNPARAGNFFRATI